MNSGNDVNKVLGASGAGQKVGAWTLGAVTKKAQAQFQAHLEWSARQKVEAQRGLMVTADPDDDEDAYREQVAKFKAAESRVESRIDAGHYAWGGEQCSASLRSVEHFPAFVLVLLRNGGHPDATADDVERLAEDHAAELGKAVESLLRGMRRPKEPAKQEAGP